MSTFLPNFRNQRLLNFINDMVNLCFGIDPIDICTTLWTNKMCKLTMCGKNGFPVKGNTFSQTAQFIDYVDLCVACALSHNSSSSVQEWDFLVFDDTLRTTFLTYFFDFEVKTLVDHQHIHVIIPKYLVFNGLFIWGNCPNQSLIPPYIK